MSSAASSPPVAAATAAASIRFEFPSGMTAVVQATSHADMFAHLQMFSAIDSHRMQQQRAKAAAPVALPPTTKVEAGSTPVAIHPLFYASADAKWKFVCPSPGQTFVNVRPLLGLLQLKKIPLPVQRLCQWLCVAPGGPGKSTFAFIECERDAEKLIVFGSEHTRAITRETLARMLGEARAAKAQPAAPAAAATVPAAAPTDRSDDSSSAASAAAAAAAPKPVGVVNKLKRKAAPALEDESPGDDPDTGTKDVWYQKEIDGHQVYFSKFSDGLMYVTIRWVLRAWGHRMQDALGSLQAWNCSVRFLSQRRSKQKQTVIMVDEHTLASMIRCAEDPAFATQQGFEDAPRTLILDRAKRLLAACAEANERGGADFVQRGPKPLSPGAVRRAEMQTELVCGGRVRRVKSAGEWHACLEDALTYMGVASEPSLLEALDLAPGTVEYSDRLYVRREVMEALVRAYAPTMEPYKLGPAGHSFSSPQQLQNAAQLLSSAF